jgi:predicted component of type VI protein secretion system
MPCMHALGQATEAQLAAEKATVAAERKTLEMERAAFRAAMEKATAERAIAFAEVQATLKAEREAVAEAAKYNGVAGTDNVASDLETLSLLPSAAPSAKKLSDIDSLCKSSGATRVK